MSEPTAGDRGGFPWGVRALLSAILVLCVAPAGGCVSRREKPYEDAGVPPSASASPPPPASKLPVGYTHARAFEFNRDRKGPWCFWILEKDGKLCPSARGPGVLLTKAQLDRAVAAFDSPEPGVDTSPLCFNPHHGIVLYDDSEKPLAAISVCFECRREALWPPVAGHEYADPPIAPGPLGAFRRLFCDELGLTPCSGWW